MKIRDTEIPLTQIVLALAAVGGLLLIVAVVPNVSQIFKLFGIGKRKKSYTPKQYSRAVKSLERQGYVAIRRTGRDERIHITPEGRMAFELYRARHLDTARPKKWDGKWRVIIFDIDRKRSFLRNRLRNTLQGVGFVYVQHSVWAFPYPCEWLVQLIKVDCEVGTEVLFLTVEALEGDERLRQHFRLPHK